MPGSANIAAVRPSPSRKAVIELQEWMPPARSVAHVRTGAEARLRAQLAAETDWLARQELDWPLAECIERRFPMVPRRVRMPDLADTGYMPKGRNRPARGAIIERYHQRECSTEEVLLELCHAGISLRRVEEIAEGLWNGPISAATVSELNAQIAARIQAWRDRPIRGRHSYVYLGRVQLHRNWGGEKETVSVLAAIGVNANGFREVLGVAPGNDELDKAWREFLRGLKKRGLAEVRLFVSDEARDLTGVVRGLFPRARLQACVDQFCRSVLSAVPAGQLVLVQQQLKEIHASEDVGAARAKTAQLIARLRRLDLPAATAVVEREAGLTLSYLQFPREHWRILRSNYTLQKILRQIRERTRVVGAFSDPDSAVLLVSARLRAATGRNRGPRTYADMGSPGWPDSGSTRKFSRVRTNGASGRVI